MIRLPLLIVGGTKEMRKKKALEIAKEQSSTFDTNTFDTQDSAGIDTVRALNQKLTRRPYDSLQQSAVLLEAQNLTVEAQNAFLKNLEESSPSAKIILTAATSEGLLSTVSSRCQKIELINISEDIEESTWRFFKKFLQSNLYNQYMAADKLDFDSWLAFWRKILLSTLGVENSPFNPDGNPENILRYLRLINKLRSLQRRRVAPKLLKTILILEAPRIEFIGP